MNAHVKVLEEAYGEREGREGREGREVEVAKHGGEW